MNSYQNRDKYNILDASPIHGNMPNRYLFAQNPNVMKNNNYKGWLNEGEGIIPSFIGSALGSLFSILEKYVSFLRMPSVFGGIVFLKHFRYNITNFGAITLTINDVQLLIQQTLDQETRTRVNDRFNAITNNYLQYLTNKKNYQANPTAFQRNEFISSLRTLEFLLKT